MRRWSMRRDANHYVLLSLSSFLAGVVGRSMVIRDLHAFRAVIVPNETYPELVVDSYAVLPLSAASQGFQLIPRRDSKRIQADDGV